MWHHTLIELRYRFRKLLRDLKILLNSKECYKSYCSNAFEMKWKCFFISIIICLFLFFLSQNYNEKFLFHTYMVVLRRYHDERVLFFKLYCDNYSFLDIFNEFERKISSNFFSNLILVMLHHHISCWQMAYIFYFSYYHYRSTLNYNETFHFKSFIQTYLFEL